MGQWNKTFVFQIQRFFTAKAGRCFDGFHRRDGCRIVFTRGLHHHAFCNGEAHGGFNFAEFERFQFRLAFRFPVEVAVNRLTQNGDSTLNQFFRLNHAVHQADFQRLFGTDVFTGGDDFQRAVGAQQTR